MEFKDRLKQLRAKRNLTQKELAGALFVTRELICQYEIGTKTPTMAMLAALAKELNTTTDYLIRGERVTHE